MQVKQSPIIIYVHLQVNQLEVLMCILFVDLIDQSKTGGISHDVIPKFNAKCSFSFLWSLTSSCYFGIYTPALKTTLEKRYVWYYHHYAPISH